MITSCSLHTWHIHPLRWQTDSRAHARPWQKSAHASPKGRPRTHTGFRSSVCSTASRRTLSCVLLLKQLVQLHPSQYLPLAKHSQ